MSKFKKFEESRPHIFCPYCSNKITKLRFNFDANNFPKDWTETTFLLHCNICSREFAIMGIGIQNKANYSEIILLSENQEQVDNLKNGKNLFCPFDGKSWFSKISEAVSVDIDEDVDMQNFLECSHCKGKFDIKALDIQNELDSKFWNDLKSKKLST